MALVPHKITALAESDAQGTDGKNIVAGAVVSLYDGNGSAVTLYDDESGNNGSTAKTTDSSGQVVVWVSPGIYDEQVNGSIRRKIVATMPYPNDEFKWDSKYNLIAHRGFRGLVPENTMAAFTFAHSIGAKEIECDVQISSDGVPVIIHDKTVDRTTNGAGNVADLNLAQLQVLDAGGFFDSKFTSTRIPTFEEFVIFAKSRSIKIWPEIKGYRTQSDIDLILDVIEAHHVEDITVLQSFNFSDLEYVRARNEKVGVGFLSTNISSLSSIVALGGKKYALLSYTNVLANPDWVKACRDVGVDIGVWTVNDSDSVRSLLDIGVASIMSDYWIGDGA